MRRRAVLAGFLLLAMVGWLSSWLTYDPMVEARRRIHLGTDEATVVAAVGRPPDDRVQATGLGGMLAQLWWPYGEAELYVMLDENSLAGYACIILPNDDP